MRRTQVLMRWTQATAAPYFRARSIAKPMFFNPTCSGKLWHLADIWRQRIDYPVLKSNVQSLAKQWKPSRVLVGAAGAGTSLVQELRGQIAGVIAVDHKEIRLLVWQLHR